MTWTDGVDRATGYVVTSANWNEQLGATGSLMTVKSHTHTGAAGDGSTSLGPLVLADFTDAAAPAAPGVGKTRLFASSSRPHYRAGAAGADFEYLVEDMFDAKGDIITSTAADAWVRKAAGADDTILMADSASSDGLKWVAPATPATVGTANAGGATDDFTRGAHVHAHEAAHINHDTTWAAKGDLIAGTANDTAAILTVGTNDFVLTADSAQTTGLKWAVAPGPITLGTEAATTTGTSFDWTGIPSTARRITISLVGVSTNGSSTQMYVQLGDSGGIETTGYNAVGQRVSASITTTATTAEFRIVNNTLAAGALIYGTVTLTLEDSSDNTWACTSEMSETSVPEMYYCAGTKATSAVLDRVRLGVTSGAFDAGVANVTYEA